MSDSGPHGPLVYLSEGMENCKMSGKNQGILRWMISGNPATAIASRRAKKSLSNGMAAATVLSSMFTHCEGLDQIGCLNLLGRAGPE